MIYTIKFGFNESFTTYSKEQVLIFTKAFDENGVNYELYIKKVK